MFNYLESGFIPLLALLSIASIQAAGGIALGTTRVIYSANTRQTSLSINNSDTKERYLVNSWVESSAGVKEKSFVVTPPLLVSEPESENTLCIIYAGVPLPKDRESLLWMDIKAIPSVSENSLEGKNVLQLAILSHIKLSVRPSNLPQISEDAPGVLKFPRIGSHLRINNPPTYYVTLVNLNVEKTKVDNVMVTPESDTQVPLPAGVQGNITFQTTSDYGAVTPAQMVSVR